MSKKSVRIIVHGRVQGVSYRAWTVGNACAYGLTGWVRNLTDGTVEALFHGNEEQISSMMCDCMHGPDAAKVSNIEQFPSDEIPSASFTWLPTK